MTRAAVASVLLGPPLLLPLDAADERAGRLVAAARFRVGPDPASSCASGDLIEAPELDLTLIGRAPLIGLTLLEAAGGATSESVVRQIMAGSAGGLRTQRLILVRQFCLRGAV